MPFLLFLVLFLMAIIELYIMQSKKAVAVFIIIAIGGAFFESVAIYLGNWNYNSLTFLSIPIWLIPGWGNAAIIAISFYKLFSKFNSLEKNH